MFAAAPRLVFGQTTEDYGLAKKKKNNVKLIIIVILTN